MSSLINAISHVMLAITRIQKYLPAFFPYLDSNDLQMVKKRIAPERFKFSNYFLFHNV